jgi:chromosome segregation ATPase
MIVNLTQSANEKDAIISTPNSAINALETSIANLTQSHNKNEATIIARNSTIDMANARIVKVETLLAMAEKFLGTANAEIKELANAAQASSGEIGAASIVITNLEASLQRAQENAEVADRTIVQHEKSLGTETMRRLILYADLGKVMTWTTALEGEAVVANTRNVELKGSLGVANTGVTALEGSLTAAKTETQSLQSSLSFVTIRYMERVPQMRASITALVGSLAMENQNLSSSLATANTEKQNLGSSLFKCNHKGLASAGFGGPGTYTGVGDNYQVDDLPLS